MPGMLCYKCGNGIVEDSHEECDDGNLENGDGCNSKCSMEAVATVYAGTTTIVIILSICLALAAVIVPVVIIKILQ